MCLPPCLAWPPPPDHPASPGLTMASKVRPALCPPVQKPQLASLKSCAALTTRGKDCHWNPWSRKQPNGKLYSFINYFAQVHQKSAALIKTLFQQMFSERKTMILSWSRIGIGPRYNSIVKILLCSLLYSEVVKSCLWRISPIKSLLFSGKWL